MFQRASDALYQRRLETFLKIISSIKTRLQPFCLNVRCIYSAVRYIIAWAVFVEVYFCASWGHKNRKLWGSIFFTNDPPF